MGNTMSEATRADVGKSRKVRRQVREMASYLRLSKSLAVLSLLCSCAAPPGTSVNETAKIRPRPEILAANPEQLADPLALPEAAGAHNIVFRGVEESGFNLHSYLAHHDGRFWAMWSSAKVGEEDPDQLVRFATSEDGHAWSEAKILVNDPDGPKGPARWISRGLFVDQGKLSALAAYVESADYGKRGEGTVWKNLRLMRFVWNGEMWEDRGVFADNCMNNFPPSRLDAGWGMACRDAEMNVSMALAAEIENPAWHFTPLASDPPFHKMDEPTWYRAGGLVHMIVRDGNRSGRLIRVLSDDDGASWGSPELTNYPDATSKNFTGKLDGGPYFLINNPNPNGRDPLAISFSNDGWAFGGTVAIRKNAPPRRFEGRAKPSGSFQYPHAIEHGGSTLGDLLDQQRRHRDFGISGLRVWLVRFGGRMLALLAIETGDAGRSLRALILTIVISLSPFVVPTALAQPSEVDVVVVGGTPGGVMAAVAAAREGRTVALLEYHPLLGGMSSNGLGKSDIDTRAAIGGLFKEFVDRVHGTYVEKYGPKSENVEQSRDGYYYEPSVAQAVFSRMVRDEQHISVFLGHRLEEVIRKGKHVTGVRALDRQSGKMREFRGRVFIDATYEGDLFAYAGAAYRLGRESRDEFNELHAGVVYQDHETRRFLPGTTGEGDHRLPAYTYRLCLTDDPANSAPLRAPPPDYDRSLYLGYFDDLEAGRLGPPRDMKEGVGYYSLHFNTIVRAFSFTRIPNKKFDVNMNPRPLGFPFAEENYAYPEADWEKREAISQKLRNITLGLLYFAQNDDAVDPEQRKMARQYHLPKDEFVNNDNFPYQLYVREARRLRGEYTLSENDVIATPGIERAPIQRDSIAAGEFPIDAFPARKREPGHEVALEGYILMLDRLTRPYQIPYRIMIPEEVEGLIVPVAASTTHVAFSTIRMEPTWMAMGQAADLAAHLAIEHDTEPRQVNVLELQRRLISQGQVLTYFEDLDKTDPAYEALQYAGTLGFFSDYRAASSELLPRSLAARWLRLALAAAGAQSVQRPRVSSQAFGEKSNPNSPTPARTIRTPTTSTSSRCWAS